MKILEDINASVCGISPYQPGRPIEEVSRELGMEPEALVKLASNESPLGPSKKAVRAMKKAAADMHRYPEGGAWYLRRKLAELHGIDPGQLVFGNGSNELIEFIAHCFVRPGRSVVASAHAFVIYKLMTAMFGGDFIEVPMKEGLVHDLRAMRNAVREDTKVVFICNPNNPTGTMVKNRDIRGFMKDMPEDVLVVFDEAYAEITLKRMPDTMSYISEGRPVVVLRSFSKAYGLAGLRIGYGITSAGLAAVLEKPRQPFNTNRMAQAAALAALDDRAYIRRSRKTYREGARQLISCFERLGLEYIPPAANFVLLKVGDGDAVFGELQKLGLIVRPMAGYGLPEWIRISIGTEEENERCIRALCGVLE